METVCLDGQRDAFIVSLSARSPRAKIKPSSMAEFCTNIIRLFECRGIINLMR